MAVTIAFFLHIYMSGVTYLQPELAIKNVHYIILYPGEETQIKFRGTIENSGGAPAHQVVVTVFWEEMDGTEHIDSVNLGTIANDSSKPFEIVFTVDHMITVKYHVQYLEYA